MTTTERRVSSFRRQLNGAFLDPAGAFSPSKFIAACGQVMALAHFGSSFNLLIDKPESMLIVLAFVVAPESFKKWLNMKYGVTDPQVTTTTATAAITTAVSAQVSPNTGQAPKEQPKPADIDGAGRNIKRGKNQ